VVISDNPSLRDFSQSGFRAPTARDVKAWANGPGRELKMVKALKARNKDGNSGAAMNRFELMSRLQRCGICRLVTSGVAPGCCICAPLVLPRSPKVNLMRQVHDCRYGSADSLRHATGAQVRPEERWTNC